MKSILTKKFFLVFAVSGILLACTKVEKGPKGDTGAAGKNTKVTSSQHQVISLDWNNTTDTLVWETSISVPAITQDIVSNGGVQVFVLRSNIWQALPYMEEDTYISFGYELGKVHLKHGDSHHLLPAKPGTDTYKVVTIANP